jgi:hypothetical protein
MTPNAARQGAAAPTQRAHPAPKIWLPEARVPVAVTRGTRYAARMTRWLGLCSIAALGSLACGESRLLDDFTEQPTRIRISPEVFRGTVPCASGVAGALQMYAVRFVQVRESALQTDAGLFDALSPAVACDRSVVLDAVAGRPYAAEIFGFDRVLDSGDVPLEEARWTAECGKGDRDGPLAPTRAVYGNTSPVSGCTTFSGEGGEGRTRLTVDQASALGSLRCGSQPGQVLRMEAVLDGMRVSAPCGEPLAFQLGTVAGVYTIELTAFEASAPVVPTPPSAPSDPLDASVPASDAASDAASPVTDAGAPPAPPEDAGPGAVDAGADLGVARWRSECVGRAVPGASVIASCEPLQPIP